MKIIFFGTSEFAIPALKAVIASRHKVLALVTQPDRKKGRSLRVSPPPTKVVADANNIPVYQPQDASSAESVSQLKKLGADLFVVVSFGQILKGTVLSIPRLYAVNIHSSLLPKYRGAAPTNWAVMNGDTSTGVTVMRMNERMDEGDIILKEEITIDPEDTNITLSEKLSDIGAKALLETIGLIENGKARFEKQDGTLATYAPKLNKEDGLIDWREPAAKIHNRVRGLLPWPGAYTRFGAKTLKIIKTSLPGGAPLSPGRPGEVMAIDGSGIAVQTGSGLLTVEYIQLEGKLAMDSSAFLRGHKLPIGHIFT
jgi:methionyl-tRNA formyltransferase